MQFVVTDVKSLKAKESGNPFEILTVKTDDGREGQIFNGSVGAFPVGSNGKFVVDRDYKWNFRLGIAPITK